MFVVAGLGLVFERLQICGHRFHLRRDGSGPPLRLTSSSKEQTEPGAHNARSSMAKVRRVSAFKELAGMEQVRVGNRELFSACVPL